MPLSQSVTVPELYQNNERAERVIAFIECLTVPSGFGHGTPFKLRDWQREFVYDVYAPCDPVTFNRKVRRAILSVARKNGKTALIAALVLVHLVGPESIQNGEIFSAANDRDQAAIVFKFVSQIVRLDPELAAMVKVIDSTKVVNCPLNGSFYKAISAEAGTKHGLNPTFVIYDELAQAKNRELYDVLDTSMGGREEPLFATISTQSRDPEHILSQLIDDGMNSDDPTIVCHLYEVPMDKKNVFDEECWRLANPALGDFRSLDDLRAIADKAARMPSEEPKFRNLYLNQRVSMTASLISKVDWENCQGDGDLLIDGEDVYVGLDLSSTNDLTALVLVSAENGNRIKPFFWKPAELLELHSDRDFGKGNHRYIEWCASGYLETTPGKTIDYEYVVTRFAEIATQYNIVGVSFDRWRIGQLMKEFDRIGFDAQIGEGPGLILREWGQGYKDMGPAVDAFERVVMEETLVHPGNPVLTWCVANAVSVSDPAGNWRLDKEKAKFRIDGAVATCMALGLKTRDMTDGLGTYMENGEIIIL